MNVRTDLMGRAIAFLPALTALTAFTLTTQVAWGQQERPNIILFYTDDQGWADTSVRMMKELPESQSTFIRTPHLERLAREGMVFSSGYASSPVCSSSRDSILYGMTPARLQHSILLGKANRRPDALTTPRAIKSVDPRYITAHFGKWACSPKTPEDAGFDVSDGRTDNWHGDWRKTDDDEKAALPADDPKRIFSVTQRAVDFIEQQTKAERPFFMRISHYAVHVKHLALKETIARYVQDGHDDATPTYAAMSENLDASLGAILASLDELKIKNNTYVIFTSDNGGDFGGKGNGPLKGGKASLWEGGLRVPTVVRGPGVLAGVYCNIPIVGWDFLPTFHELAGGIAPLPDGLDGRSLASLFKHGNRTEGWPQDRQFVFHYPWYDKVPMSVIREGAYKVVLDLNTKQSRLFNLATDPGETRDLSNHQPKDKRRLLTAMTEYLSAVQAEDLEELRTGRINQLQSWMEDDREALDRLKAEIANNDVPADRKELRAKLEFYQRRQQNHQSALKRVEVGRTLTAW